MSWACLSPVGRQVDSLRSLETTEKIDVHAPAFYTYFVPRKGINSSDLRPVSTACDCLLCRRYSRAYLFHLFRSRDMTAGRLATIHNLRFYSLLMEKLQQYNLQNATVRIPKNKFEKIATLIE